MRLPHLLALLIGLAMALGSFRATAQVKAPSQGGGVGMIRVTDTTMELSFGTNGTGQGRVVAIAITESGAPVPLEATDGQFYTAATSYGKGSRLSEGYVVYNGTGNSVVVSGLKPNTFYYVTNAEYNTDSTTIAYNTNGNSMSTSTRLATDASADTPLPVELTAFTGTVDAYNLATLHWATASERNAAYFALERSADGVTFAEAGRVAASGTSTHTLSYQWPDPQRLTFLTYYRLRQVDNDGKIQYSSVVTLAPSVPTARLLQVYPNPSEGHEVQLLLQGYDGEAIELDLTDALGRLILTQKLVSVGSQYLASLPLPQNLVVGSYILTLRGSSNPVQKRITISN